MGLKSVLVGVAIIAAGVALPVATGAQSFVETFSALDPAQWLAVDYRWTHPRFDTDWRAALARADDGLSLGVIPSNRLGNRFDGASVRRLNTTGFGRYEAVVRPAAGAGLVSGFFIYTGPFFGVEHSEIDIEFMGRDTSKVNLAVFAGGQQWDRVVSLGYDAALKPRRYSFEWSKTEIRWYAGSRLLAVFDAQDGIVPSTPGYIYSNIWAVDASLAGWAGKTRPDSSGLTRVNCIAYSPVRSGNNASVAGC